MIMTRKKLCNLNKVLPLRSNLKQHTMEKEEKKWGGRREGSGRKPMSAEQKRVDLTMKIKPSVAAYIRKEAKERSISIGKFIEYIIEESI